MANTPDQSQLDLDEDELDLDELKKQFEEQFIDAVQKAGGSQRTALEILDQAREQVRKAGKVRENRLRRAAKRQGLQMVKSRRRDPRALDYGEYVLFKGADVVGSGDIDEVEVFLLG